MLDDRNILDTLCSFEDFELFKELVIQSKKGNLNPKNQTIELTSWTEENVMKISGEDGWVQNFKLPDRTS